MALHEFVSKSNTGHRLWYQKLHGINIPDNHSASDRHIFAHPIESINTKLAEGLTYDQKTIQLAHGHTNSYSAFIDSNFYNIDVRVKNKPFALRRLLINDKSVHAAINAGFFYFVDTELARPPHFCFNFSMQDDIVYGLPSSDGNIFTINKDGQLDAQKIPAHGIIDIGEDRLEWSGKNTMSPNKPHDAVLYNSACSRVISDKGEMKLFKNRVVDTASLYTEKNSNKIDIVVAVDPQGVLRVSRICSSGEANIFEGNFVLQIPSSLKVNVGDPIKAHSLGNLDIRDIKSGLTIGPSVHEFEQTNPELYINSDLSLGDNPPFANVKKARSVIYANNDGHIGFRVFDGIPGVDGMEGVTPSEVLEILTSENSALSWAHFLDPGKSSNLAIKNQEDLSQDSIIIQGNNYYQKILRPDLPNLWYGKNGRKIPSAIIATVK